jgi:5-methylcytosine-specific restriction protein A
MFEREKLPSNWQSLRERVLKRDAYLCQCARCKAEQRSTLATEVDHIVSRAHARAMGWSDARMHAESNLQSLNRECHKRKTQEEQGKTFTTKKKIGLDGFAIEEQQ